MMIHSQSSATSVSCSQLHRYFTRSFCADILSYKQLQSQTVIREKLCKTLSYKKAAHKMLVKSTPGDQKLSVPIEASSTRFLDQAEKQSNSVITNSQLCRTNRSQ